jgi:hypothetical protein
MTTSEVYDWLYTMASYDNNINVVNIWSQLEMGHSFQFHSRGKNYLIERNYSLINTSWNIIESHVPEFKPPPLKFKETNNTLLLLT